jgi:AcrR family transcriptional regulator
MKMSKQSSSASANATETIDLALDNAAASAENDELFVRPLRADALRNRARILAAAEEVFALEGVGVPIDVVAERARVGVGTLYRHFPTKEALFEAIVFERLQALLVMAKAYGQDRDPGDAIYSFLHEFGHQAAAKKDLMEAISSAGIDIKSKCQDTIEEIMGCVDELRRSALATGSIRSDVSAEEIVTLVVGTCQSGSKPGIDDERIDRMISIVCDGLRP